MKNNVLSSARAHADGEVFYIFQKQQFVETIGLEARTLNQGDNAANEIDYETTPKNDESSGEQADSDNYWLAHLMVMQTKSLPRVKQLRALINMSKSGQE